MRVLPPVLLVPKVKRVLVGLALLVSPENNLSPQVIPSAVLALPVNGPMLPLPKSTAMLVALLVVLVKPVPSRTGMLNLNLLVAFAVTVKLLTLTFPLVLFVPKVKRVLGDLVPIVLPESNLSPHLKPPAVLALPVNGPMLPLPPSMALLVALLVLLVKPIPPRLL